MSLSIFAYFLIFIIECRLCQETKRYDNYTLYNIIPTERYQLKFLQTLESKKYIDVIFWRRPFKLYSSIQILVSPMDVELFEERLVHFGIKSSVSSKDIQKLFDKQTVMRYMRLNVDTYSWTHYHSLEDVYQWMADIADKHPKFVHLTAIGMSAEGREILALSIERPNAKAKVMVEGAIHGNEWITCEFVTFLANEIINSHKSEDHKLKKIAHKFHWFFVPVANPDGYAYSMKTDRLWRYNRRPITNMSIGVDLNRNFDYNFCVHGSGKYPQEDDYCGPQPFSEPESSALSSFIATHKRGLNFYFSFHAYGQKILIPYSDRVKHVENFAEMENYGKQAIMKMYRMSGVKYYVGTMYDIFGYRTSGDSASFVKKKYGVKYVITFLLRDNGTFGYALPSNQILPTCKETVAGLAELMTARHRRLSPLLFSAATISRNINYLYIVLFVLIYYTL
ncbi:zinc carboxypeptidase-like [Leptidea sinapis]|uniref:zinc carboxypeptidase-like n=1 Tax=Leptidea sinapis TaxID=189913 RepID=UPI002136CA45|nr:zinc carboxypeptidase-like [Leptidea sinapis]